ncbi:MAG: nucleotidyltransferase family protein [Ignavibacteriales bacterium]|nr:nucleotidyltransferase family protein [Ignavibacteriales bacterium]
MNFPKALLHIHGRTFLEHIVRTLRTAEIQNVVIVLGADAEVIRKQLRWYEGTVVINEHWELGQLSSLLTGLDSLSPFLPDGILIWPVDRPLVETTTVSSLVQQFQACTDKTIVPTYHGKRGHPVIFGRVMFSELATVAEDIGARALLWHHPEKVLEHITDDDGVIINIDTPEDYEENVMRRFHTTASTNNQAI